MNDYEKILTLLLVFQAFTLSFQISTYLMLKDLKRVDHERRMADLRARYERYRPQSVYDPPAE